MEIRKNMKILLFKTGAIGDVLMTTPLVRQLRKNYPKAEIDYLVGDVAAEVLEGNKNIDKIIRFEPKIFFKRRLLGWMRLVKDVRGRKSDIIFILDKHWIFNYTSSMFNIPVRIGFDRLGKEGRFLTDKMYYGNDKHEIYYYLDLLKCLDIKPDIRDSGMDLFIDRSAKSFAADIWKRYHLSGKAGKKIIGIAPGGGHNPGETSGVRNWPIEKYAELVGRILDDGHDVILLGSKSDILIEKHILENIQSISIKNNKEKNAKLVSMIAKTDIKKSAAVIERCDVFICNDSGPMHIAASVNKRIISIFGPTNPLRKAPLWKESISIWKDKRIYEPDYELFGKQPDKDKGFMRQITVDDVWQKLHGMIR
jgi:lipopolysaccharide heptosyltransferase II